jgi:ABC-2 type transport system ATP-binding protein
MAELRLEVSKDFAIHIEELSVLPGDKLAVVGHNGAGKSVFLECLAGHHRSDAGRATVLGTPLEQVPDDVGLKKRIGVQLQRNAFPPSVPVRDIVALHRALYGQSDNDLYDAFELGQIRRRDYGVLSRGQKQRIDLYMALAHRPRLALLDEASSGLDATFAARLGEVLRRESDGALIMASHEERELEVANKVLWLDQGQVVACGARDAIVEEHLGRFKVELVCDDAASAERCEAAVAGCGGVRHILRDGRSLKAFGECEFDAALPVIRAEARTYTLGRVTLGDFLALVARRR